MSSILGRLGGDAKPAARTTPRAAPPPRKDATIAPAKKKTVKEVVWK